MNTKKPTPEQCREKSEDFQNFIVEHPMFVAAKEEIMAAIQNPHLQKMIFLVGPSGSGKSEVCAQVLKALLEKLKPELGRDPSRYPAICANAPVAVKKQYPWIDLYQAILGAGNQVRAGGNGALHSRLGMRYRGESNPHSLNGKKADVDTLLLHRRPEIVMLDEAEHLAAFEGSSLESVQLNVLKTISGKSVVPYLLASTYALLPLAHKSAQVSRRQTTVHLGRYHFDIKTQRAEFLAAAKCMLDKLGMDDSELLERCEFLFEGTVGCVGNLKDWIQAALDSSLADGRLVPDWHDMERKKWAPGKCLQMLNEALEGEAMFAKLGNGLDELRHKLGFGAPPEPPAEPPPKVKGKAFRRRPTRKTLPKLDP